MSLRPASASSRAASARSAITLGAAFALFCAVFTGYDIRASRAAGGLVEAVFGRGAPPEQVYYGGYAPVYRAVYPREEHVRVRHAKRARAHYAQARRQIVERRKFRLNRHAGTVESRRPADPVVYLNYRPSTPTAHSKSTARSETAAGGASRRAICVRACDGYYFPALPVSRPADLAAQQANCEKLCPGAQARLFVLPEGSDKVEEARAARSGDTYAALLSGLDPNDARARSCSCQTEATAATATQALLSDTTLRPGDSVVTSQGVRVVKRGSHYPYKETDFLSLAESGDVPLSQRSALDAIEKALKTPQGRLAVMNGDHRRRADASRSAI